MALCLGRERVKITLDGVACCLNLFSRTSVVNTVGLMSSDGYVLKDSNGVYVVPKDYIGVIIDNIILSADNYILTDSNGVYLIAKDG